MRKIIMSAVMAAATLAATPSFATGYGYGYSQPSYGYHHSYRPVHHGYNRPHYYKPAYTHTYVKPEVTKQYETRSVYFYEKVKVKGYCKDVIKTQGYSQWRQTVHCKKGEAPAEAPAEKPAEEPAEAPAPEQPPK